MVGPPTFTAADSWPADRLDQARVEFHLEIRRVGKISGLKGRRKARGAPLPVTSRWPAGAAAGPWHDASRAISTWAPAGTRPWALRSTRRSRADWPGWERRPPGPARRPGWWAAAAWFRVGWSSHEQTGEQQGQEGRVGSWRDPEVAAGEGGTGGWRGSSNTVRSYSPAAPGCRFVRYPEVPARG